MTEVWHLLQSGRRSAAENMAMDEVLLQSAPQRARPLLRFYSWSGAPASFGYFQSYAEVSQQTPLRPLVRRPTGGGVVPHENDWTYSLIFPPQHSWYGLRALESYRRLHQWIQKAFARLNVTTELAEQPAKTVPGLCFAGPDRFDLVWGTQKIAGAAQRRTRSGLLIQGSIQNPPPGIAKADWQQAFCDVAHFEFNVRWEPLMLAGELLIRTEELAKQREIERRERK